MVANPQFTPDWAFGYVPPAAEWNADWGRKQDAGAPANVTSSATIVVQSATTNAPPTPVYGSLPYIVGPSPTGAWSGHAGKIAAPTFDSSGWNFFVPVTGAA